MKRKYFVPVFLMVLLFCGKVYAETNSEYEGTGSLTITDDNRYDSIYYQKPEKRYASSARAAGRSARANLDFETYIVNSLEQFQSTIDVSEYEISNGAAGAAFFQILNSHHELFYVEGTVKWKYDSSTGKVKYYYGILFRDTPENVERQTEELEQGAEQALTWVDSSMNDLEKALTIHDYLVLNCEYDEERRLNGTAPAYSHSAYGALVDGRTVCDGYSHAYAYILEDKLGIPCELVTSESMNHAWNMILIDGAWYHVDVTWDDPVWDRIGKVQHSYFLLSDKLISDSTHRHSGWTGGHTASSTTYDRAFWNEISSAFCYRQGNWYYSKYYGGNRKINLMKKRELLGTAEDVVYTEEELWNNRTGNYMCLDWDEEKNNIYFNTRTGICKLNQDETAQEVYRPELLENQLVFGFTIKKKQFCYWVSGTPDSWGKQSFTVHDMPDSPIPVIEGISAQNINAVYDGKEKRIDVKGLKAGDRVSYKLGNGTYSAQQPRMTDVGTYQVQYQVERAGCDSYYGNAQVVITQAVPTYEAPKGLQGKEGGYLQDVALPRGFSWQSDGNVRLEEGRHTYYVKYQPEDRKNYREVIGIAVEVTVHVSSSQGEVLKVMEGISAENIKKTYDGKAKKITINGVKSGDVVSYAGESGEYGETQPVMIETGNYQVRYKVERAGYEDFYGSSRVEIVKAVPSYTVPAGLKGDSGKTIDTVKLPTGFSWQTASGTRLLKEGNYTYYVRYNHQDKKNYSTVSGIAVKVAVSCPGHQYVLTEKKEATRTKKGQETYVCKICGDVSKKEIKARAPEKPGKVTGLKVSKKTADSLTFSWKKEKGVNYRLVLYKGKSVVSTKYTGNGSYTYKKLKPAAEYTLKVLSYRKVNGENIYAASGQNLKTTTTPKKVKLTGVKQKGSKKAELTWTKVTGASGYEISMKTDNGKYKKIKTIEKGKTVTYKKSGLKKGRKYSFRVRAYKKLSGKKVYGDYSNVKSVKITR